MATMKIMIMIMMRVMKIMMKMMMKDVDQLCKIRFAGGETAVQWRICPDSILSLFSPPLQLSNIIFLIMAIRGLTICPNSNLSPSFFFSVTTIEYGISFTSFGPYGA